MIAFSILGLILIVVVIADVFATVFEPRTVERALNLTTVFYGYAWRMTRWIVRVFGKSPTRREALLGKFGPASLIGLIAVWAALLMMGFALLQYGLQQPMNGIESPNFGEYFYLSATTFLTLGYGDLTITTAPGRFISVVEAMMGFGMLAAVIGYLPVMYQAFSRSEQTALLLDARAGSPPTASALLKHYADDRGPAFQSLLEDFEKWSAGLLESFLSFPVLSMYRSQHKKLSWLACMTCILDACAFVQAAYSDDTAEYRALKRQAAMTFALARHAAVDLAYVLNVEPVEPKSPRLTSDQAIDLAQELAQLGAKIVPNCDNTLDQLRANYEPYLFGLAKGFMLEMPPWNPQENARSSWEQTAWESEKHF